MFAGWNVLQVFGKTLPLLEYFIIYLLQYAILYISHQRIYQLISIFPVWFMRTNYYASCQNIITVFYSIQLRVKETRAGYYCVQILSHHQIRAILNFITYVGTYTQSLFNVSFRLTFILSLASIMSTRRIDSTYMNSHKITQVVSRYQAMLVMRCTPLVGRFRGKCLEF